MAEKLIEINQGVLKRSIKQVMNDLTEDLREVRNKTPETVAKKILTLSQGLVPVLTGTLKKSGRLEKSRGEGISIIYDATVKEEQEAQTRSKEEGGLGRKYAYRFSIADPNQSYAEFVDNNTKFLSGAIDLFNKSEPIKIKLKNFDDLEVPLEIDYPKRGYIFGQDIIKEKRAAKARQTIKQNIKDTAEFYSFTQETKKEHLRYIKRLKNKYKKTYGKPYNE